MNRAATLRVWVIALGLIVFGSVSHADENADANRLFVNALKIITQAEAFGISSRAKVYAEASEAFTEILENYPGSDIAVKLLTNQDIGNFKYERFLSEFQYTSSCVPMFSVKCSAMIFDSSLLFVII